MEGLGALGFWLGLGIFLAGGAVGGAFKELGKEREKQATLRAMLDLEAAGKLTPETRASMHEMIASGAGKEIEKEREKQATLREALRLEAEGKLTPETLALIRQRDAEDRELTRAMWGLNWVSSRQSLAATIFASAVGMLSFMGGMFALGETRGEPWPVKLGLLFGIWAGGLVLAWLILLLGHGRKANDRPAA